MDTNNPALQALRHYVTGAIERGEAKPVVERPVVKNGYIAHYNGMRIEIRAETLYQAVCAAREEVRRRLGRRKPDFNLLAVVLAEKGGEPVTHDPAILPGA